jgi:hypothetical protein
MNQYTYDFEVETMVTMFMNAMSDIVIKRFRNRQMRDRLKVRIVYAPKERVLNDLLDRDQNLQLPVMSVSIGGITRDNNRTFNKILGSFNPVSTKKGKTVVNEKQPLPIDLNIKVSIMTRYQQDMDQILSHLLPYINPYFVVSWRTPSRPDHEIRSNVIWDGNTSITYPIDLTSTQVARVVAELSFVLKGWIFQAIPDYEIGNIFTIHSNYYIADQGIPLEYRYDDENTRDSSWRNDYRPISGVPPQPKVVYPDFGKIDKPQQFLLYGSGFTSINNVYLSGAPFNNISTTQIPFSSIPELSSINFKAVKLPTSSWTYDKDNLVTFVMPSASQRGYVDVILESPCGIGSLKKSVRFNTFNPYVSGHPEYSKHIPYQLPFLSGIKLI